MGFDFLRGLSDLLPTPWVLLLLVFPFIAAFSCAYWVVPWVAASRRGWVGMWVLVAGLVLLGAWQHEFLLGEGLPGAPARTGLVVLAATLLSAWLVVLPGVAFEFYKRVGPGCKPSRDDKESVRRLMTDRLVCWGGAGCLLVLAGLVDRAAWLLAFEYRDLVSVGLWLAVVAAVLRVLAPMAGSLNPTAVGTRGLLALGQVGGYLLVFLLCAWWVSIVQRAALGMMFGGADGVDFWRPLPVLLLIAGGTAGYLLLTGRNFEFLNLSSLHGFYRARLVRSYLGAANPARFGTQAPLGAANPVPAGAGAALRRVYVAVPDDDVPMADYGPHLFGGPVHLINVCLNQTRDPRGGLFNQDRRGQPLAVAPGGLVRVGQAAWQPCKRDAALTLGAWTAISGAAVAPGLGAGTRGGLAALLAFAGVRLGYWWTAEKRLEQAPSGWGAAKTIGLLREVWADFKADPDKDWFLSDGGHFENTGVHALLAEKTEFIVVADCGADPDYRFGDLENLVRKARIDFGAEIVFLKPRGKASPPVGYAATLCRFGALATLSSADSSACLALAQIHYADGERGLLLVVKPNLCDALPVDLLNFAADNPSFPQQTTGDQFFDEAQWESYYQLGRLLADGLTPAFIEWLVGDGIKCFETDCGALADKPAAGKGAEPAQALRRLPAYLRNNAVGATVGLGGLLTVGVPLWSEVQKVLGADEARRAAEIKVFDEIAEAWAKLPPEGCDPPKAAVGAVREIDALAQALQRNSDILCANDGSSRQRWALPARYIVRDAQKLCDLLPVPSQPRSCLRLREFVEVLRGALRVSDCQLAVSQRSGRDFQPMYWAYAYAIDVTREPDLDRVQWHPADPDVARVLSLQDEAKARQILDKSCAPVSTAQAAPAASSQTSTPVVPPPAAAAPEKPALASSKPAEPQPPSPAPVQPVSLKCAGKTIYMQIYGPAMRNAVRNYREPWRLLGASVPPIEDVYATADSKRRARPQPFARTTVLYHDEASKACADVLGDAVKVPAGQWESRPLPPSLRPTPGVIEVWVANPAPQTQ